jgi:hypothetical protein
MSAQSQYWQIYLWIAPEHGQKSVDDASKKAELPRKRQSSLWMTPRKRQSCASLCHASKGFQPSKNGFKKKRF